MISRFLQMKMPYCLHATDERTVFSRNANSLFDIFANQRRMIPKSKELQLIFYLSSHLIIIGYEKKGESLFNERKRKGVGDKK